MTRPTEEVIADTLEVLEVFLAINKVLKGDEMRITDLMHELRQILIKAVEEDGDYHGNFVG